MFYYISRFLGFAAIPEDVFYFLKGRNKIIFFSSLINIHLLRFNLSLTFRNLVHFWSESSLPTVLKNIKAYEMLFLFHDTKKKLDKLC